MTCHVAPSRYQFLGCWLAVFKSSSEHGGSKNIHFMGHFMLWAHRNRMFHFFAAPIFAVVFVVECLSAVRCY